MEELNPSGLPAEKGEGRLTEPGGGAGFQALIELRHAKNLTAPIFCVTDPINPEK